MPIPSLGENKHGPEPHYVGPKSEVVHPTVFPTDQNTLTDIQQSQQSCISVFLVHPTGAALALVGQQVGDIFSGGEFSQHARLWVRSPSACACAHSHVSLREFNCLLNVYLYLKMLSIGKQTPSLLCNSPYTCIFQRSARTEALSGRNC